MSREKGRHGEGGPLHPCGVCRDDGRPHRAPLHPCGVCHDDGRPHRAGVHATQMAARFIDHKKIAGRERRRLMSQVRATRREQFRNRSAA